MLKPMVQLKINRGSLGQDPMGETPEQPLTPSLQKLLPQSPKGMLGDRAMKRQERGLHQQCKGYLLFYLAFEAKKLHSPLTSLR